MSARVDHGSQSRPVPGQVVYVGAAASVQFAGRAGFAFRVISVDPKPTYDGWCWLAGYVLKDGEAVDRRSIYVRFAGLGDAVPTQRRQGRGASAGH
jgi:hypothetical protein